MILDSGAVIAFTRGDIKVAAMIRSAHQRGDEIAVSPVVVAETIRGGREDASVHRLLNAVRVTFVGLRLGRLAGELLGGSQMSSATDALVMAEAVRSGNAILLTSDPNDMRRLARDRPSVVIVPV
ncbi:MAG: PIN domain-containing protein [Candidatus Dormibacteria bacterium]